MRVYLDDDSADALLVALLTREGRDVQTPAEGALAGMHDPVHLAHAVRNDRVLLSHNHDDFEQLHDLILAVQGRYPGLLIVRRDNDPRRDLELVDVGRVDDAAAGDRGEPVAGQGEELGQFAIRPHLTLAGTFLCHGGQPTAHLFLDGDDRHGGDLIGW